MPDLYDAVTLDRFHEQVKRGDLDAVRQSVQHEPALLDGVNAAGQNAILLAKYYGQAAVADFLLAQNPRLDIYTAAAVGKLSTVVTELDRDPTLLTQLSSDGWTVLHLATFFGHPELVTALLERGAPANALSGNAMHNTPLHAGIAGGKLEAVRALFAGAPGHDVDVNAKQHGGWTALHGAAQNGSRSLVELLIAQGADLNARADNNQSALDLALSRGHGDIVLLLEELGAKSQ